MRCISSLVFNGTIMMQKVTKNPPLQYFLDDDPDYLITQTKQAPNNTPVIPSMRCNLSFYQAIPSQQPLSHQIDAFFYGSAECFDSDDEVCWFIQRNGKRVVNKSGRNCELSKQSNLKVRIDGQV